NSSSVSSSSTTLVPTTVLGYGPPTIYSVPTIAITTTATDTVYVTNNRTILPTTTTIISIGTTTVTTNSTVTIDQRTLPTTCISNFNFTTVTLSARSSICTNLKLHTAFLWVMMKDPFDFCAYYLTANRNTSPLLEMSARRNLAILPTYIRKQKRTRATDYQAQIDEIMGHLTEVKKRLPPNTGPVSVRTPDTLGYESNPADQIERALRADGHRIWGFVVYRCTYESDEDWRLCMQHIHENVRQSMEFCNALDLLDEDCFKLTVIEDKSKLDRASTWTVRQNFHEWCGEALNREQGSNEEIASRRQKPMPGFGSMAVRYRFCVQVDAASLQSIVHGGDKPWVKLVRDDWKLKQETAALPSDALDYDEGDYTDDEDEEYPLLEGNIDEDVGWMMVHLRCLMPTFYSYLWDPNTWTVLYCRPPYVLSV
ncbi:hypothetical protein KCU75_g3830, partial [Aureobasidium melanogenum]